MTSVHREDINMKRLISMLMMCVWLCACDSRPPVFVDFEALQPNDVFTSSRSETQISIQALETIKIHSLQVNRGHCSLIHSHIPHAELHYGQKVSAVVACEELDIREITVNTDQGMFRFNF